MIPMANKPFLAKPSPSLHHHRLISVHCPLIQWPSEFLEHIHISSNQNIIFALISNSIHHVIQSLTISASDKFSLTNKLSTKLISSLQKFPEPLHAVVNLREAGSERTTFLNLPT